MKQLQYVLFPTEKTKHLKITPVQRTMQIFFNLSEKNQATSKARQTLLWIK